MKSLYRMASLPGKWLFIALMAFTMQVHAAANQDSAALVTLKVSNAPIEDVFLRIEAQTGFSFTYSTQLIDKKEKVSVDFKREQLGDVLRELLGKRNLRWVIRGAGIVILQDSKPATQIERFSATDSIPINVQGVVTDESGNPIPGATILIKGSGLGASSNGSGAFTIPNVGKDAIILVSSIGYELREERIHGRRTIQISLQQAIKGLDETIVIGYGSTSRRFNTGSVSKIKSEQISQQPISNPISTLQGRMPGVFISTQNGMPGGNVKVQVRGQNSVAAGTSPLYIVDGVPFNSASLNTINSDFVNVNGPVSPLNIIPSADIESIEVLKDADATGIYGSRGANGVILITTKKGRAGKLTLDVDFYKGVSKVARFSKFLSLPEYLKLRREGFANDGSTPTVTNAPDLLSWDTTASTDWQKFIIGGRAPVTNLTATLSGGNKGTRFYFGINQRVEGTVLPGNQKYSRTGGRLNVEHTDNSNRFYANIGITYTKDKSNLIKSVDVVSVASLPPNFPAYNKDGTLNWILPTNPIAWLSQKANSNTTNFNTNVMLRYSILPGLNIKANLGYSEVGVDFTSTSPKSSQWPVLSPLSFATFGSNKSANYIVEPQAEYSNQVGKNNFKILVGGTWQRSVVEGYSIRGSNYTNESMLENLSYAGTIENKSNNYSEYIYASFFSRLNYIRSAKYLLSTTFRRDGSTRFGPNNRYGNFWSLGAGWIFTNESFFEKFREAISYGKIRASYGTTGNDQINNYQYLATYGSGLGYLGHTTLQPAIIANPNYGWELSKKLEFSLEWGLFSDRLLGAVSRYYNRSGNQLVSYPIPFTTGFGSYQANFPATVENTGWEIELNTINIKRKNISWTSAFNVTVPKNKLIRFPNIKSTSYANAYEVGEDLSIVKKIRYLNVDPQTGVYQFEDIDKDGKLTFPNDYINVGKLSPDFFGGISNGVQLFNFQLDVFFQFVKQKSLNNVFFSSVVPFTYSSNSFMNTQNNWKVAGDLSDIQRATSTPGSKPYAALLQLQNSSRQLINSSYMRLKNISLSYSLPNGLLKKIKISSWRVYAHSQNLITFSMAKNIDPETVSGSSSAFPVLKTLVVGTQITL